MVLGIPAVEVVIKRVVEEGMTLQEGIQIYTI